VKGGRRLWTTDGKLPGVTDYRTHARNAAAMWGALSKGYGAILVDSAEVRIVAPSPHHALRAIVLDPWTNRRSTIGSILDTVLGESGLARRVVEDASGEFDLSAYGLEPRLRMTVMAREPGVAPECCGTRTGVRAVTVDDAERLAAAERIQISIFPPPAICTAGSSRPGYSASTGGGSGSPTGKGYRPVPRIRTTTDQASASTSWVSCRSIAGTVSPVPFWPPSSAATRPTR